MRLKIWTSGLLLLFALAILGGAGTRILDEKDPPEKIVFETKRGDVTYLHAKHAEREKEVCETCHDVPFKKSAEEPLHYKKHKQAEKEKASCATCHVKGGKAFESRKNCNTCHEKKKT